jgi:hypothetical protein
LNSGERHHPPHLGHFITTFTTAWPSITSVRVTETATARCHPILKGAQQQAPQRWPARMRSAIYKHNKCGQLARNAKVVHVASLECPQRELTSVMHNLATPCMQGRRGTENRRKFPCFVHARQRLWLQRKRLPPHHTRVHVPGTSSLVVARTSASVFPD